MPLGRPIFRPRAASRSISSGRRGPRRTGRVPPSWAAASSGSSTPSRAAWRSASRRRRADSTCTERDVNSLCLPAGDGNIKRLTAARRRAVSSPFPANVRARRPPCAETCRRRRHAADVLGHPASAAGEGVLRRANPHGSRWRRCWWTFVTSPQNAMRPAAALLRLQLIQGVMQQGRAVVFLCYSTGLEKFTAARRPPHLSSGVIAGASCPECCRPFHSLPSQRPSRCRRLQTHGLRPQAAQNAPCRRKVALARLPTPTHLLSPQQRHRAPQQPERARQRPPGWPRRQPAAARSCSSGRACAEGGARL